MHEFAEMGVIFLYLAFFFCAISTYSMLLLNKFEISYFTYGASLINALVVAKVILIGEYARIGRKQEAKPLFYSAIYKAFVFCFLVFAFHRSRKRSKSLCMDTESLQRSARCASMTCSHVPLSYFALSFHSLRLGNCNGCLATTNFERCFSG